jgi:AcrR family transcriptional regulator
MTTQAERLRATRATIVKAATKLFGRQGYGATSVDDVAAAAGVAKGAVYHHFASKDRLFETVLESMTADLANDVMKKIGSAKDVWDSIAVATEAYFELVSTGAAAQVILKDGPAVLGWQRWREIDAAHFGAGMPTVLEAAMREGLIETQPVEPLVHLLLGAATEAAAACAASPDPPTTARAHAKALRALLDGLRRR